MFKIKDRILLGTVAGLAGDIAKNVIDEISHKNKLSQRSFRETAAGVWVKKNSEAKSLQGQILGGLLDLGMSIAGGVGIVYLLTETGRDRLITKGLISGVGLGSMINFMIGALPQNKIKPTDATSNLSYMVSHAAYGLITTAMVAKLGHPSLFDKQPINDYLEPTELTTEQQSQKQ
ncbi:hypothetical protein MFMK1_003255 [Metallumcola ferriviriculae]|uniref:DUF1440 domain-containing protein n=1 Tax=Metallumcola ferriviriculae TaxID=3039180 RepID=A0AAU0UQK8_9FIRM|nr:hypothetical protein MFMK1_003255 [Desulfitibacteraceae bacterium MK1]